MEAPEVDTRARRSSPLALPWVPHSPQSPTPPLPSSRASTPRIPHLPRLPHRSAPSRPPFLIGIDFGTTYSGVAWGKSSGRSGNIDPQNIHVITDWPGGEDNSAKVPTRIQYTANGEYKCGYEIPTGSDSLKWFKLLLVREEDIPQDMRDSGHINRIHEARQRLAREHKDVVQVIADYLRFLWNNAIASIEKSETSAVVNSTPYVVVLTFPALWKPDAVQKMRDAAALAGILDPRRRTTVAATTLHTVEEPEAAALATYADLRENHSAFRIGESFVVLDAGGGTCDLVTYEVLGNNPLQLRECVRGNGGLCGAVFLDEEFDRRFKSWVGKKKIAGIGDPAYRKLLEDNWERVLKKRFDGTNRDWSFPIPQEWEKKTLRSRILGRRSYHSYQAELPLTTENIKEVFRPILEQIYELVLQQVSAASRTTAVRRGKKPNAILLAGGLGGNRWLYNYLDAKFPDIELVQRPYPHPWSAICRGAVIRADIVTVPAPDLNEAEFNEPASGVIFRKSRHSYGIAKFVDFIPGFHDLDDRFEMESVNRVVAINQMEWYIKRDDDMLDRQPQKMDWKRYLPEDWSDPTIGVELWHCDQNHSPPTRKAANVRKLCRIEARLPPLRDLPVQTNNDGKIFHVVHFDLLMTPQGTSLEWTVWINGKKQGERTIDIVYS